MLINDFGEKRLHADAHALHASFKALEVWQPPEGRNDVAEIESAEDVRERLRDFFELLGLGIVARLPLQPFAEGQSGYDIDHKNLQMMLHDCNLASRIAIFCYGVQHGGDFIVSNMARLFEPLRAHEMDQEGFLCMLRRWRHVVENKICNIEQIKLLEQSLGCMYVHLKASK